jgi:hypothetical protein
VREREREKEEKREREIEKEREEREGERVRGTLYSTLFTPSMNGCGGRCCGRQLEGELNFH